MLLVSLTLSANKFLTTTSMISPQARIEQHFKRSLVALEASLIALHEDIANAADMLVTRFTQGGKMLICGNGGSAMDSLHFSSKLLHKMDMGRRRPLPAVSLSADISMLTSIANDCCYAGVFSKQVEALGNANEVLVAFSTSGRSVNMIEAMKVIIEKTGPGFCSLAKTLATWRPLKQKTTLNYVLLTTKLCAYRKCMA